MSQISLKTRDLYHLCLYFHHCCSHSFTAVLPTTSPTPQQPNHVVCHIILWLVGVVPFSTNRNVFSCLQTLANTFVTKARFYHFFLHETQSKHDGNVSEKAWRTLFTLSLVLDVLVCPSSQEVVCGCGLAASYTRTSTDPDSTLLSLRIEISSDPKRLDPDSFSLINPKQSV